MQAEQRGKRSGIGMVRAGGLLALALALTMGSVTDVRAAPFTSYFDALIEELEARSATLDPADKVQKKQKKAVDKVLKAFAKDSTGLDKDLKLAAKAAKTLAKAFPDEFAPQPQGADGTNLKALVAAALANFDGDVQALLAAATDVLAGAPPGKCKDKAQAVLDDVAEQLAALADEPDCAVLAKALGKALKTVLKGDKAVAKALGCVPKLKWYISIASMTVNGEPKTFYDNAMVTDPFQDDEMASTYFGTSQSMFVYIISAIQGIQLDFNMFVGSTPIGPHFIVGNFSQGTDNYQVSGEVTITKFPSLPGHVHASFDLAGDGTFGTKGSVDLTGTFAIYTYDTGP